MRRKWQHKLQGTVQIEIRGKQRSAFINAMAKRGIQVWNVHYQDADRMFADIYVKDYFRLRPLLKQTGCRVQVRQRKGWPFRFRRIRKRKGWLAGLGLFFVCLYVLSSLVWDVQVEGNEQLSSEQILEAARQKGLYEFQWLFRLDDPENISRQLLKEFPGVSWIGIRREGVQITIKVVEATLPEPEILQNPRNLVASYDAVITNIFTEQGVPRVGKDDRVKRGDVLISGVLGDEENQEIVVADGKVMGLVWHTMHIEVPLKAQVKTYTGQKKERKYLVLGDRALKLFGYGGKAYEQAETQREQQKLSWREWTLPISWMSEEVRESEYVTLTRTPQEAKAQGLEQARAELLSEAGEDASIVQEKLLHEKTDSGKVYMNVFFEVEQNIAKEQAIIQIDQGE
ncbi:sporulation protein YqfD [Marinicrinis sediminis]|uniref:Sporulation protein YqfD n=1 Tax=Marinicrinis sediminis TaxID=1652465 RepID=A0ABW5RBI8_9BACL